MEHKIIQEGVTFDDVLLVPEHSDVLPDRADTSTRLTRNIQLNVLFGGVMAFVNATAFFARLNACSSSTSRSCPRRWTR